MPSTGPSAARALIAAALLIGCQPSGPDRPHTRRSEGASELRDIFNADSGKVRVLMLVAPT